MKNTPQIFLILLGLVLASCNFGNKPMADIQSYENACSLNVTGTFNRNYSGLNAGTNVEINLWFSHDPTTDTIPSDLSRGIFIIASGKSSFSMDISGTPQLSADIAQIEVNNQLDADTIIVELTNLVGLIGAVDQSTATNKIEITLARVHPDTSQDWGPLSNDYIPINEPLWTSLDTSRTMTLAEQYPNEPNMNVLTLNEPSIECTTVFD